MQPVLEILQHKIPLTSTKHASCMELMAAQEGHEQPLSFKGSQSVLGLLLKYQAV